MNKWRNPYILLLALSVLQLCFFEIAPFFMSKVEFLHSALPALLLTNINFAVSAGNTYVKTYSWFNDDLIIKYNEGFSSVTIKNYEPNENTVININGTNLATILSGIMYGTDNNDQITIDTGDRKNIIQAGNGNDYITNNGTIKYYLLGEEGNDTIINNGNTECMHGGIGNDSITNEGTVTEYVFGGDGDDIITNNNKIAWDIWGGAGNDEIINNNTISNCIYGDSGNDTITNNKTVKAEICGGTGNDTITNNGTVEEAIRGEAGDDTIINYGTIKEFIEGGDGNDIITNNGTIGCQLWGGAGDDTIINNGNAGDEICGGRGNDTITTGQNSSVGRFLFDPGDGNDTLYLNAKVNNLDIFNKSADIVKLTDLTFNWNNEDLIIGYNNNLDSITIKNYCPDDQNIIVNICVGWNNSGGIYTDLATLVPEKSTTQTMSLGASNTGMTELKINELDYQVATFTSSGNSDMQLNYTTPDTSDISVVMSEYTNTDLQNV